MPLDRGRSLWASHGPSIAGALGAILFLCAGLLDGRAAAAGGIPDNVVLLSNLRYRDGSRACVLDLALPKARADRPRPAVVVIHGGGWIEGDKSSFDVQRTPGNIIDFAAAGFVAASVNYRLSREAPFPAGLYDCQAAVRWLRAHAGEYHLDPNRIGAYGNSAGGHLALLLGLLGPSSGLDEQGGPFPAEASGVQAVVSDSGTIDLVAEHKNGTIRTVIERFLGGPPDQKRLAEYQAASPINHLAGKTPPLLLIYGEADNQVDARTADHLVSELSHRGQREISYFRLAGVGHCPHSLIRVPYLRPVVIEFFQRTLGK
ncbi:MAG TPA: alpha/beta hydrolase [Planctomycetaceae bacterium]|nr:alpha/beta hydrolase [Planctomycetaceae bacterium]